MTKNNRDIIGEQNKECPVCDWTDFEALARCNCQFFIVENTSILKTGHSFMLF
jgi:hypothetical protein